MPTTLGTRMEQRRKELEISQSGAARSAGVSRSAWIAWEKDTAEPEKHNHAKISRALRWTTESVEAALAGEEPTPLPAATVTPLPPGPGSASDLPPDDDFVRELRAQSNVPAEFIDTLVRAYWADRAKEDRALQEKYRAIARAAGG